MLIEKIILGTAQLGMNYGVADSKKFSHENSLEVLSHAWNNNVRKLDTATAYGDAISMIAQFHQTYSDKRFNIHSKFKLDQVKGTIRDHLRCELAHLDVPLYSCYMLHSWDDFKNNKKIISDLLDLKGHLVGQIGISIYTTEQLEQAIYEGVFDFIQFPFNVLDNYSLKKKYMEYAYDMKVELHARSVFLQGLLLMNEIPPFFKDIMSQINELRELAQVFHLSIGQLCLAYVLAQKEISSIIIGVEDKTQLDEHLKTLELFDTLQKDQKWVQQINHITIQRLDLLNPTNWRL